MNRRMNVAARVMRSGDWWAVEVPEIPGLFTQARRIDQVDAMVVHAVRLLGYDVLSVQVRP